MTKHRPALAVGIVLSVLLGVLITAFIRTEQTCLLGDQPPTIEGDADLQEGLLTTCPRSESSLMLWIGSDDGISRGQLVVNRTSGRVGRVVDVEPDWSFVATTSDTGFAVGASAVTDEGPASGCDGVTISATVAVGHGGETVFTVICDTETVQLPAGTAIVTADPDTPNKIEVGIIKAELNTPNASTREYELESLSLEARDIVTVMSR